MVLAVLLTAFFDYVREYPAIVMTLSVALAVLAAITAVTNQAEIAESNSATETRLHHEAGLLLVNFDPSDDGDVRRCAVFAGLEALAVDITLIGSRSTTYRHQSINSTDSGREASAAAL